MRLRTLKQSAKLRYLLLDCGISLLNIVLTSYFYFYMAIFVVEDLTPSCNPTGHTLELNVQHGTPLFQASGAPRPTDDAIVDVLPAPPCNKRLLSLLKDLKKVESVSKALQGASVTLLDARVWFGGLIAVKPHYARFLGPRADILHSPHFESGCVRVLGGSHRLTRTEKVALQPFCCVEEEPPRTAEGASSADSEDEGSFVEYLQKRRRLAAVEPRYDLLSCIPPTSNLVERFFTVARTTYGQERHSLQSITLELVLFLRQNGEYWTAQTVDEATR
ncbi:hypothetical protein GQ600_101 [Phytophthora cactorum]|nr:hypothetical protein GQ600_101 [Phytophthora cactorum]